MFVIHNQHSRNHSYALSLTPPHFTSHNTHSPPLTYITTLIPTPHSTHTNNHYNHFSLSTYSLANTNPSSVHYPPLALTTLTSLHSHSFRLISPLHPLLISHSLFFPHFTFTFLCALTLFTSTSLYPPHQFTYLFLQHLFFFLFPSIPNYLSFI